jgi:hypothetical protein
MHGNMDFYFQKENVTILLKTVNGARFWAALRLERNKRVSR